jgi:hypothetical protein
VNIGKNRFSAMYTYEAENADDDLNSYDRSNFVVRYDRLLPRDFAFYASLRFEETDYDQPNPLFMQERSDDLQELAVGISKTLWWSKDKRRSLAAQLSHTHTESDSNISLYEYERDVTASVFTLAF